MKEKFVKKFMRVAKLVGEDQNPCYSRKIGVVIADPVSCRILGTGYNGPPRGTPHCDDPGYLAGVVWPQLTEEEKDRALRQDPHTTTELMKMKLNCVNQGVGLDDTTCDKLAAAAFCGSHAGRGVCPRRSDGAPSGKRLELCSCAHGEANAIVNAAQDLQGAWMFAWCGVPCIECTKLVINSGVKCVHALDDGQADYSHGSRRLLEAAAVRLELRSPEYYLSND